MPKNLSIEFGALAPPLRSQLSEQGLELRVGVIDSYQRMADAVTLLTVQGCITQADAQRARKRLLKRLAREVRSAP